MSRDTWAAIVLYIRNFLINWAIFLPALFTLALALALALALVPCLPRRPDHGAV